MNDKQLIILILMGIGGIYFFNRRKNKYPLDERLIEQERDKGVQLDLDPVKTKSNWPLPVEGMKYLKTFNQVTSLYDLPDKLLARVAYQESRFRPDIITGQTVSKAGAQGLMQIIPRWHPSVDPLNPEASIWYAGKYLKEQFNRFKSWPLALAAYNWGPGNLSNHGFEKAPAETHNYVHEITNDLNLG